MKILMVVSWYTSKKEKILKEGIFHYEQSQALLPLCEDVRLYWPFDVEASDLEQGYERGLYTYRSHYNEKRKIKSVFKAIYYLKKICKEFKPDIIHVHCACPAGIIAIIAGKSFGIPVVLTEHCPIEQMKLNNLFLKLLRKYIYKNTKVNVCVSEDSMKRLSSIFSKCKYELIYNGIEDPSKIKRDGNKYRVDGYINCGIVGVFYDKYVKGYQYLIPAIETLKSKGKKIVLHICGGGEYEEYYKELAKSLNIENECVFYGQCDRKKVYSIIEQMDFCVSASIYESAGISVQEQMIMGKPTLVTKSGGASSLTNEFTSIVVDKDNQEVLVKGLEEMLDRYKAFDIEQIRKYAYENFEISKVTKQYINLYNGITNKD